MKTPRKFLEEFHLEFIQDLLQKYLVKFFWELVQDFLPIFLEVFSSKLSETLPGISVIISTENPAGISLAIPLEIYANVHLRNSFGKFFFWYLCEICPQVFHVFCNKSLHDYKLYFLNETFECCSRYFLKGN